MDDILRFSINTCSDFGADYAEARYVESDESGVNFENNKLNNSFVGSSVSLFIRFKLNNSMSSVFINDDFSKSNITSKIKKQIQLLKSINRINKKSLELAEPEVNKKKYVVKQKNKINFSDIESYVSKIKPIISKVNDSRIINSTYSLSTKKIHKKYINTDGSEITSTVPHVDMFYFLTVKGKNKSAQRMNFFNGVGGWELFDKWKVAKTIKDESETMIKNIDIAKKVKPGVYDYVIGSEVAGIMVHESVGHPYEADRILGRESAQAGESFIKKDMIGQRAGSDYVTINDDPTIDNVAGYYLYDEEGLKSRNRTLIKNGIINEFYHDRQSAMHFGLKSNASARIDNNSNEPLIRMANTFVKPGKSTEASLIKDVKKGIYMKNFMEWNIDDKRYNFKAKGNEAYLIENGEITDPLLFPNLEVDTIKLWTSVDGVGNKSSFGLTSAICGKGQPMQGAPVSMGGPSLLLRGINHR